VNGFAAHCGDFLVGTWSRGSGSLPMRTSGNRSKFVLQIVEAVNYFSKIRESIKTIGEHGHLSSWLILFLFDEFCGSEG